MKKYLNLNDLIKNMKKGFIVLLLILFLCSSVFGAGVGETLRIDARYKENQQYTQSNATIKIFTPDANLDVYANMTEYETGKFYYDYLIPDQLGTYNVRVNFTNSTTGAELSEELSTFEVSISELDFGTCPSQDQRGLLYALLIGCVVLYLMGEMFSVKVMMFVSGIGLIFSSLYLISCATLIGGIALISGAIIMIRGAFKEIN